MAAELNRIMKVRRAALDRFDETVIKKDAPMATMEEALVPLYMYHRYAVEAAASAVGGPGLHLRLPRRRPHPDAVGAGRAADAPRSRRWSSTLKPSELALPKNALMKIPPRPSGWGMHRELFARYTGDTFDPISPASQAADVTIGFLLQPDRAARMVAQHAIDPPCRAWTTSSTALRNGDVRGAGRDARTSTKSAAPRRASLVERLMALAGGAPMPQVRAIASAALTQHSGRRLRHHDRSATATTRPRTS